MFAGVSLSSRATPTYRSASTGQQMGHILFTTYNNAALKWDEHVNTTAAKVAKCQASLVYEEIIKIKTT